MKKLILTLCFASGIIKTIEFNAQVTIESNVAGGTNYVGWDASVTTVPLEIRHNANQPINFFTNNTERMRLTQTGELGLGTNAPASFLHLNTTSTGELFRTDGAAGNLNVRT